MKKLKSSKDVAIVQVYRVECNHGSKYFADDDKASAYFDYMTACGYDAELWAVRYCYDDEGSLIRGEQILLESETDERFELLK